MQKNSLSPSQGKILISEPALNDKYFERSIVLLAEHNEEGTYGLIINKPTEIKLNEVAKDILDFNNQLYLGGPVNTDNLYILHQLGNRIKNSKQIATNLYWGGNIDDLKDAINENPENKHLIRFYVGYSSWVPYQLEDEIEQNSWIVQKSNLDIIFSHDPKKLWGELIKNLGKDYAIWANYPANPTLN